MKVTLRRITFSREGPTYGMLLNWNLPLCLTLERPWDDNKHDVSCIPAGIYPCIPHNTPGKPNCWEITNVPNRTGVLFHAGNSIIDSLGCVLVGLEIAGSSILKSQDAMTHIRSVLPPDFTLEILNPA